MPVGWVGCRVLSSAFPQKCPQFPDRQDVEYGAVMEPLAAICTGLCFSTTQSMAAKTRCVNIVSLFLK